MTLFDTIDSDMTDSDMTDSDSPNLLHTLFPDSDDIDEKMDPGLLRINQMFSHLNFNEISKYYDLQLYNDCFPREDNEMLSVYHFNIRGAHHNKTNLETIIHSLKQPDIIALTETWFSDSDHQNFILDGYQVFNVVRNTLHGGSSILVKSNIDVQLKEEFSLINAEIEICTVSVKISDTCYNISSIYRPHTKSNNVKEFRKEISKILKDKFFSKSKSILIGDFNINLLQHQEHQETNNFLNTMQELSYLPAITRPTRFPEGAQVGSPSLLDHLFINFSPPSISGILHYKISDHLPIFINILTPKQKQLDKKIQFRLFNQENKGQFTRRLCYVEWENLLIHDDVDQNFNIFFEKFKELYNISFPIKTKTLTSKRLSNPWLTSGLLTSIKQKNKLFKNLRIGLTSEDRYNTYRNKLNSLIRLSKKNYYLNIFKNFKNSTKKIWKTINSLTKSNTNSPKNISIISENKLLCNPDEVADAFNSFFTNIASKLDSDLPPAQNDPLQYLTGDYPHSMAVPPINLNDVINVIKTLKSKPCKIDDFSVEVIKNNSHLIAQPLANLFNQSIAI